MAKIVAKALSRLQFIFSSRVLGSLAFLLLIASCVPNRKYQMMQKNDVNISNLPPDSVMREYSVKTFDYKIQTNDIISVRFESISSKEFDFLSGQNQQQAMNIQQGGVGTLLAGDLVDEDGKIPFPVIGKVRVAGLTVFQAQDSLQALADKYLESPIVKVRLLNFRVTFLGEVNKEGVVIISNNRASMLEAIGLAGGLTDLADKTDLKLIRQKGSQTEIVYLNVLDENFLNSPYYYINQNDVVVVPALKQRPYRKYFGQNLGLILSSVSLILIILSYTK